MSKISVCSEIFWTSRNRSSPYFCLPFHHACVRMKVRLCARVGKITIFILRTWDRREDWEREICSVSSLGSRFSKLSGYKYFVRDARTFGVWRRDDVPGALAAPCARSISATLGVSVGAEPPRWADRSRTDLDSSARVSRVLVACAAGVVSREKQAQEQSDVKWAGCWSCRRRCCRRVCPGLRRRWWEPELAIRTIGVRGLLVDADSHPGGETRPPFPSARERSAARERGSPSPRGPGTPTPAELERYLTDAHLA